jgi:hypothetical protein
MDLGPNTIVIREFRVSFLFLTYSVQNTAWRVFPFFSAQTIEERGGQRSGGRTVF